jgi:hypothetical protein
MIKIAQGAWHSTSLRLTLLHPGCLRLSVFYYWIASAARGKLLAIIYQHLEFDGEAFEEK